MREKLKFLKNFNNKLNCDIFTTIRLNSDKYFVGKEFDIILNEKYLKVAKIVAVKELKLHQITKYIAGVDVGCSSKKAKEFIKEIYHSHNLDWEKQKLDFILLETIEKEKQKESLFSDWDDPVNDHWDNI